MHRGTAAAALVAALANLNAASGQVQIALETRLLLQEITGSGASRTVTNVTGAAFAQGSRVRLTVQYRLTDMTNGRFGTVFGLGRHGFSINGTNTAGNGTLTRSALTTAGSTAANGESDSANNSSTWTNGASYPQTGTSPSTSGLHNPFRGGLNGMDAGAVNGTISNGSILSVWAGTLGGASTVNQLSGQWWGLYSFEFQSNPSFIGDVGFTLVSADPDLRLFRGADVDSASVRNLNPGEFQTNLGSTSLRFGDVQPLPTPPTVQVIHRIVVANPLVSGDANNLVLATFSDSGFDNIDVTITSDGGLGALGGLVSILGDNSVTPSMVLNWDAPNAAIGRVFTVSFSYTDGLTPIKTGSVTVQVIPAPSAIVFLGLGGLLAARRRRA